jgi:hypothetical protein
MFYDDQLHDWFEFVVQHADTSILKWRNDARLDLVLCLPVPVNDITVCNKLERPRIVVLWSHCTWSFTQTRQRRTWHISLTNDPILLPIEGELRLH